LVSEDESKFIVVTHGLATNRIKQWELWIWFPLSPTPDRVIFDTVYCTFADKCITQKSE